MLTKEEFTRRYASLSDVSLAQLDYWEQEAFPCDCTEDDCEGWQMRRREDYERDLRVFAKAD